MKSSDSYMWKFILDFINIDEHIEFVTNLINKYTWKVEEKNVLVGHLSAIKNKQKDKCVNISVIGEFSSGKSSFINALLGEELLVSSMIQGTTVVNTILDYSIKPYINVLYKNNKTEYKEPNNKEELKKLLSRLTTDNNKGKEILYVVVGYPSELLKNNIRIIDTPGTNSTIAWHEEVTKRAIKDVSDISVILTDATRVLPQTLMSFMEDNLSSVFSQCAIAITRSDLIKKSERIDVYRYVELKIKKDLDVEGMLVFPFAAPALVGETIGEKLLTNQEEMAAMSRESIQKLLKYTAEKKQIAQIKKLLSLIDNAYDSLSRNMDGMRNSYDAELRLLQRSSQAQLEPFIHQQKKIITDLFKSQNVKLRSELVRQCDIQAHFSKNKINNSISKIQGTSVDVFKDYMDNKFLNEYKCEASRFVGFVKQIQPRQEKLFREALRSFQSHFNTQFTKLGILKIEFDINEIKPPKLPSISESDIQGTVNYISSKSSEENWAYGSGAIAGMAIGTAIAPGIGTVIGLFAGLFAGSAVSPDIEKVKKDVLSKIQEPLGISFSKIKEKTIQSFDDNSNTLVRGIEVEIDRYIRRYKTTVNQKVVMNQKQQNTLKADLRKIDADLSLLKIHKNQLEVAMCKIK